MYKKSMFCYVSPRDILFNSKNGIIAKLTDADKVRKILSNPDAYIDDTLFTRLRDDEMVVLESVDERQFAQFQEKDKIYSSRLGLIILPTENCNFNCSYCYQEHKGRKMSVSAENAIIKYLQKNISKYSAIDIGWFGGEPLIAFDTIARLSEKMITICKQARRQYSATISTNGYNLNVETFKKLLEYKIISYQVTLDGDKQHHDGVRQYANGKGTYDTIINNLRDISNKIKSTTFSFVIRTNVTVDMLPKLNTHLAQLHEIFSGDKRFSFLFRPVGDWGGDRITLLKSKLLTNMDDIYSVLLTSKYKLNHFCYYPMLLNGMCEAKRRNSFVITPTGSIRKCTLAQDKEFNCVGQLLENGTMILDPNKMNCWIRDDYMLKEKCADCFYLAACNNAACPLKYQDGALATSEMCGFEKESIDSILELLTNSESRKVINITEY